MPFWSHKHPPLSTLKALDRLFNTLWYVPGDGWGDESETISARSGRLRDAHPWVAILARALDWIQPFHDDLAIDHDRSEDLSTVEKLAAYQQHEIDEYEAEVKTKMEFKVKVTGARAAELAQLMVDKGMAAGFEMQAGADPPVYVLDFGSYTPGEGDGPTPDAIMDGLKELATTYNVTVENVST